MLENALVYEFIFGSLVFWASFLLCDLSLKKAIAKGWIYMITLILYLGIGALYFMSGFSSLTFVAYIIGFLPFIIIPLLYKDSIAKIVFTYFTSLLFCLMIHLSSNILTNHVFQSVASANIIEGLTPDRLFRIITIALMIIYILLVMSVLRKMMKNMLKTVPNGIITTACILPVFSFITLLCDYVLLNDLTNMNGNVISFLLLMTLMLCIYIVLYQSFTKQAAQPATVIVEAKPKVEKAVPVVSKPVIVKKEPVSDPNDLMTSGRHYYEMLLNHYMDMNSRTQMLDDNLQTMNSLLLNDNVAGATVFIDRISQAFHDHDVIPVCNNHSINLLFSYYYYTVKKDSIYLETHINLPGALPISDLDLCILFGHCMENAIEACRFVKNTKERFINVDCKIQNGYLMIIIDNSFDGFINKVNNQLKSRKKFGGVGLKTVKAVVDKYQGSIDTEYPQNVFSIFLKLSLNPKKERQITNTQNQANKEPRPKRKKG